MGIAVALQQHGVADPGARAALDPRVRAKLEHLEAQYVAARTASQAQQDRLAELRLERQRAARRAANATVTRETRVVETYPAPGQRVTTFEPVPPRHDQADAVAHLDRQLAQATDAASEATARMRSLSRTVEACRRHLRLAWS